jgi:zinc protease
MNSSVPVQAADLLAGRPLRDLPELLAAMRSVTADAVYEVAVTAYQNGLLMAPQGTRPAWTGFTRVPGGSGTPVTGSEFPALTDPEIRLVIGTDGVSLACADGSGLTVRYDACAAMLAYPDGGRLLIGHDGTSVPIEPGLHENVGAVVPYVDSRIHPDLRVDQPARAPDAIPRPQPDDDEDDSGECCDDDCCDSGCCDGDCCSDDGCAGECCAQCCDDDCCDRDCCDGDCCSSGGCRGRCCTGVRGAIRRLRTR